MNKETSEDLVLDALLENLMSCSDAEVLAEAEDESAAHTLSVLLGAVTEFQHKYVEELRARRNLELQRLHRERAQIPESPAAQRAMLAHLLDQQGEQVTLQHRNLTEMTDEDIKSALAQIMHLVDEGVDKDDEGGHDT